MTTEICSRTLMETGIEAGHELSKAPVRVSSRAFRQSEEKIRCPNFPLRLS
jgi:hypothetical protein